LLLLTFSLSASLIIIMKLFLTHDTLNFVRSGIINLRKDNLLLRVATSSHCSTFWLTRFRGQRVTNPNWTSLLILLARWTWYNLLVRVCIATGYGMDDRGVRVRVPVGSRIFFSIPSLPSNGYRGLFPWGGGVKQQGCEADHSPPTSAEVKKTWIYTFAPPQAFMA
jgi:hypothetical protein